MVNNGEIRSFRGEYNFLSNFYPCTVVHDGKVYPSLEAAFQAAKCNDLRERDRFQRLEPAAAKKIGKQVAIRSDWEAVKLSILKELVRIKFISEPHLLSLLLSTGDAYLSEDNMWHDNFYGNCTCARCRDITGLNYLGHTLMSLRDQISFFISKHGGVQ